ncbi:MAG: vWA domain-containing protein [Actinomycetales bacterium]
MTELEIQAQAAARLAAIAAGLGHRLHLHGLPVTADRSRRFAEAVAIAEPGELPALYWLGRVTLLDSREQVPVYDRVFRETFRGLIDLGELASFDESLVSPAQTAPGMDDQDRRAADATDPSGDSPSETQQTPGDAHTEADEPPSMLAALSERERLNDRDFSALNEAELLIIRRLVEQLPVIPPMRRARRTRRANNGRQLDIRTTLRRAHRTAGDPVRLAYRRRTSKPRRVLLIADVSGSLEPYARVYLPLMRGAVVALKAEAFVFATRLTRLTRALQLADADAAYRKVAEEARDWSGGTRIGLSLKEFLDRHGRRGLARGAVVVIVSDGWETADPRLLGVSMERLARLAHRVIWVNPRKAAAQYQPLVGGMVAALAHVDTFVSGHSVRAIEDVLAAIAGRDGSLDRRQQGIHRARNPQ